MNFGALRGLPPHPPAGHAPGLARQIIKGGLEGLEPAGEACGSDEAIGRRRRDGDGLGRWPQASTRESVPEEMDARRMLRVLYAALAQLRETFPRIEELEGGRAWLPLPFPIICPLGMGREGATFTTRPRAAMTMRRRTADSAGRSTRSTARWRGCGIRDSRICAIKPQQGEKDFNDPLERFAVAFDGQVPVHVVSYPHKNKTGT